MKIRRGFVTNSSSSSFIIVNKTGKKVTLKEFAEKYGKKLCSELLSYYDWYSKDEINMENLLKDMEEKYQDELAEGYIECGDHLSDDGLFQFLIHAVGTIIDDEEFTVDFSESHH